MSVTIRANAAEVAIRAIGVLGLTAGIAAADFRVLDSAALREAVSGKTVRLETAVGSIPINFKADGTMVGRTLDMISYLGRGYDQGTWWIDGNQLCQKWKLWLDAKPYCFVLRQVGEKVRWTRNDGLEGTISVRQ